MNNIEILKQNKQSIWIDYISKDIIESGELKSLIEKGITGLTSNPSIFEKAISTSDSYDEDIKILAKTNPNISKYQILEEISIKDIKNAADLLLPTYESSSKLDGYASIEVSPYLAYNSNKTIEQAIHLSNKINMPNVLIKVPATKEGIVAIETLTEIGIKTNATLMFNQSHYINVAESFIRGAINNSSKENSFSVASFFVSRVDTAVDELIANYKEITGILGKTAVYNSQLAYLNFLKKFNDENSNYIQKPLWGSTSTKNQNYSSTLYVDELVAPNSINTMPMETIHEFTKNGNPKNYNGWDAAFIQKQLDKLDKYNIDLKQITQSLQDDGIKLFQDSFDNLLKSIENKLKTISKNIN
tara:strand:- start:20931 stop:22007 length:1077 start_codon:yes stop_codon:yes gene_type:complete